MFQYVSVQNHPFFSQRWPEAGNDLWLRLWPNMLSHLFLGQQNASTSGDPLRPSFNKWWSWKSLVLRQVTLDEGPDIDGATCKNSSDTNLLGFTLGIKWYQQECIFKWLPASLNGREEKAGTNQVRRFQALSLSLRFEAKTWEFHCCSQRISKVPLLTIAFSYSK